MLARQRSVTGQVFVFLGHHIHLDLSGDHCFFFFSPAVFVGFSATLIGRVASQAVIRADWPPDYMHNPDNPRGLIFLFLIC